MVAFTTVGKKGTLAERSQPADAHRTMQEEIGGSGQEEIARKELVGNGCPYCEDGTLTDGRFKGDFAVLCPECDTPAYRTFL